MYHPFRACPLYLVWPWFNAGTPGHFCLTHSSRGVPPRRARHLGTALTGNFPQVDSGRGTQAYLCLCPNSFCLPLCRPCPLSSTNTHTHTLYLSSHTHTHTANSDIKPRPDVGIFSLYRRIIPLSTIWPQAVFCINESQNIVMHYNSITPLHLLNDKREKHAQCIK